MLTWPSLGLLLVPCSGTFSSSKKSIGSSPSGAGGGLSTCHTAGAGSSGKVSSWLGEGGICCSGNTCFRAHPPRMGSGCPCHLLFPCKMSAPLSCVPPSPIPIECPPEGRARSVPDSSWPLCVKPVPTMATFKSSVSWQEMINGLGTSVCCI